MPFSQKTLDFLFENHLMDSRIWFNEHHDEYRRYVIEPLSQLVVELSPCMMELDEQIVTIPRVDKTICRIWRDIRYSHDKSLYRDSMWICFKRGGKMNSDQMPGVYFEITADGFNYGCGFYRAPPSYMNTLRTMILADNPVFLEAKRAYEAQRVFQMDGECFKRPRYPEKPEDLRLWLERRNISFDAASSDFDLLFSDRLAKKLAADFKLLKPIYHLLLSASLVEL